MCIKFEEGKWYVLPDGERVVCVCDEPRVVLVSERSGISYGATLDGYVHGFVVAELQAFLKSIDDAKRRGEPVPTIVDLPEEADFTTDFTLADLRRVEPDEQPV